MANFAVRLVHGPGWDPARQIREQDGWDEHAAFMDGLVDGGFLVLGGPVGDGETTLHVVEAADENEIAARLAADPWAAAGLLRIGVIEPWALWLDSRPRTPRSATTRARGPDPAGAAAARSYLYVPGDREDRLHKAETRDADALILDLEDSVAPARKGQARQIVAEWLSQRRGGAQVWVRITSEQPGTDIGAAVSAAVTGVVVPKADPRLLATVDELLTSREAEIGLPRGQVRVLPLIETAAGLLAVTEIAGAPRVARLGLGEADLAAGLGIRPGPERAELMPLRLQVVVASAARGIAAPVAPTSTDFRDLDALHRSTRALLALGFRARTAIHPAQVPVINAVFTPSADEVERARRLVEALDAAERDGAGVTTDEDGTMVDVAVARSAREILGRAGQRPGASG
jgi:citrate lyase subunit beta/citryl-CoA lyase